MLLKKLPKHIEVIYLANPSLSRDEMLYAIADGLKLSTDGERIGLIMRDIQSCLLQKAREGKRVVVLVDEAHAMPLDTLEQLRLLYNLQVGKFKLLQLVLFGQPELNEKLEQPNMRQLKDRIVHHFNMQPLSLEILENYLMFRMRTANYHGPNIFSSAAIKLIAKASNGLMRRANVLADKALLAAFIENTHYIELRHIEAAMRDSEIKPSHRLPPKKWLWIAGGVSTAALLALATWWELRTPPASLAAPIAAMTLVMPPQAAVADTASDATTHPALIAAEGPKSASNTPSTSSIAPATPAESATVQSTEAASVVLAAPMQATPHLIAEPSTVPSINSAYEQRLKASIALLAQNQASASIQLFYSEGKASKKLNEFLQSAEKSGTLGQIYLLPLKLNGKEGMRVMYGNYASVDAARNAVKSLPASYQENFAISIYSF